MLSLFSQDEVYICRECKTIGFCQECCQDEEEVVAHDTEHEFDICKLDSI